LEGSHTKPIRGATMSPKLNSSCRSGKIFVRSPWLVDDSARTPRLMVKFEATCHESCA
jgi:hypothetical protein